MSGDIAYSTPGLAEAAGVTVRQVQHWTDEGLLRPLDVIGMPSNGSGNRRVYSADELAIARRIAALTSVGIADAAAAARRFAAGEPEVRIGDLVVRVADHADREETR